MNNRRFGAQELGLRSALLATLIYLSSCAVQPAPPPRPPLTTEPIKPIPVTAPTAPISVGHAPIPTTSVGHPAKASWYGPGLAGKKTASGEVYNPNALTAASKTLPIGTVVKVTNPSNGKSVKVRINDRGPFVPGRSLDLSRHAAQKIGIIHKGVARVKVSKTPDMPSQTGAAEHN